jgi:uncharacterized protein YcgI (DUF1989 family)
MSTTTTTPIDNDNNNNTNEEEEEESSFHNQRPPHKQLINRRDLARQTAPIPCYKVEQLPSKYGSKDLYDWLRTAVSHGHATLLQRLEIPPREARSWQVPAGCLWRIVCHVGPQVADMNCWHLSSNNNNKTEGKARERFYSSKTRQIHATHLSRGDRLWSNFPYLRPMATIVEDTIDYGFDDDGAGVHDVIGSRCDPYTNWYMTSGSGQNANHCCHSNLTRQAILHDDLQEDDVHDVLNVFMCTGYVLKQYKIVWGKKSEETVGNTAENVLKILQHSTSHYNHFILHYHPSSSPIILY